MVPARQDQNIIPGTPLFFLSVLCQYATLIPSCNQDGLNWGAGILPATVLSKTERIVVRASAPIKQLLQEAARACHKNVSEFLLDAGITAANQALADRRSFELDEAGWAAFQQALDRPVQAKPRLAELLLKQ